jgi:hypothetical protein
MSVEAYDQYQIMISDLDQFQRDNARDIWSYAGGSASFMASQAYSHLLGSTPMPPVYNWLWDSNCLPKRKVFFWLVLKDN